MRIAVTGSIATDHLMQFPGRFAEQFVADQLENVSLSFLVDQLEIRRGGVGANIAYGMGQLGLAPVLVGAVGADFEEYRAWLERSGVDTKSVLVSETQHTSRFLCTTDEEQNQIASFYAGAMSEAREIELRPVADRIGGLDLVVIGADDPAAMVRHSRECRENGIAFAADPSQQLARLDGADVKTLIDGAAYLFTNEYESSLLLQKTGWTAGQVLERAGEWITTRGAKGVQLRRRGAEPVSVAALEVADIADPTGVGDGFRAGFFWALAAGLGRERSLQAGCTVAAAVLRSVGTQQYDVLPEEFTTQIGAAYGAEAAAEIGAALASVGIEEPPRGRHARR
ncbi:MAG TPA: carbohydrate kinase family protein [Mycobacteriales bacterium]|nr:carbohydrate kinase family protein [Mycobacteriales bacterium]